MRDYANSFFTHVLEFRVESLRPNSNIRTPKSTLQIAHCICNCKLRSEANSQKVKHNFNKNRKKNVIKLEIDIEIVESKEGIDI